MRVPVAPQQHHFLVLLDLLIFKKSGVVMWVKELKQFSNSSHSFQHVTRTFHDLDGNVVKRDSGIWINGFDYTGISHITPHIPEINDTIRAHCEEDAPLCGFPWYLPVHFLIRWVHYFAALVGGEFVLKSYHSVGTSLFRLFNTEVQ